MALKTLVFILFLALLALPARADGVALNLTLNETLNVSTTGGVLVNALTPDGANLVLETNYLDSFMGPGWVLYFTRASCKDAWQNTSMVNRSAWNNQTNQTTSSIVFEPIPPGTAKFSRVLQSYPCQSSTTYFLPLNMKNASDISKIDNLTKQLYTIEPIGCGYRDKECKLTVTINREVEEQIRAFESYTPPIYITITKDQFDKFVADRDLAMQESRDYMAETAGCKASMQEAKNQAVTAQQEKEKANQDLIDERTLQGARVDSCLRDYNATMTAASGAFLNGTNQGYANGYAVGSGQAQGERTGLRSLWVLSAVVVGAIIWKRRVDSKSFVIGGG